MPGQVEAASAIVAHLDRIAASDGHLLPRNAGSHAVSSSSATTARIKGGDYSGRDLAKYMGMLSNVSHLCTAAVVAPRVVVTDAFCARNIGRFVIVGDSYGNSGANISIARVIYNPCYDGTGTGTIEIGIAVAILSRDVPDDTPFMKVSVSGDAPANGTFVRIAGYGRFTTETANSEQRLQQVDVPVTDGDVCAPGGGKINKEMQFCAGYDNGECDVCPGDAGAPVFQYSDDGTPIIVGVTIIGRCGATNHPYPFTRISAFREQLEQAGLMEGVHLVTDIDGSGVSTAVIIGAAVAGVVVILVIIGGIVFWMRKPPKVEVFHPEDGQL